MNTINKTSKTTVEALQKAYTKAEKEPNDFYATEPRAIDLLLQAETFNHSIWECACGQGHIAKALVKNGYAVYATDLIDRGYGMGGVDFLLANGTYLGDIITNPPYSLTKEFVLKALSLVDNGNKVAMLCKSSFLETKNRYEDIFKLFPPKAIYIPVKRINCAKNGDFERYKSNAFITLFWIVWEKGYQGDTTIKWLNDTP